MMRCDVCGWEGNPDLEETGPHTKALCRGCGKYIKMVGKKELDKLIADSLPPITKAFTITKMKTQRGCSACYTEDPNGWCMKNDVVMIETFNTKLYLCEHHRMVLSELLKNI